MSADTSSKSWPSTLEPWAPARTRRGIGLAVLGGLAILAVMLNVFGWTERHDRSLDEGLQAFHQVLHGHRDQLPKAQHAFRQALRSSLFDAYPALLLSITERMAAGATGGARAVGADTTAEPVIEALVKADLAQARQSLQQVEQHTADPSSLQLLRRLLNDLQALETAP